MNSLKKAAFLSSILMLMTASAQAGKQGISYFYGIGAGVIYSSEEAPEMDAAAAGELIIGIEEDGWAFEYSGFRTLKAGTDVSSVDYTTTLSQVSLAYRTIEKAGLYYKIKVGNMSADYDFTGTTASANTDGKFIGIGMGMRMDREARAELEYALYSSDDIDTTHMLTIRYLFGGTPYSGADAF